MQHLGTGHGLDGHWLVFDWERRNLGSASRKVVALGTCAVECGSESGIGVLDYRLAFELLLWKRHEDWRVRKDLADAFYV